MNPLAALEALTPEMTAWRRDIHAHPELSGQESRTSKMVFDILTGLGLSPESGIGGEGVVAVIEGKEPGPSIGLRADMDALPMNDDSGVAHASKHAGVSHACGHDGHTATLLGTARHLAANPPARGRVVLIFQPAEETGLGAKAMMDDGLFERYPCDEVYAYHNMPLLPFGEMAVHTGPTLNGYKIWEIDIQGVGGHGAAPHKTKDPVQAAVRVASEISSIIGRHVDPMEPALCTVTKLQAGSSHNVVPHEASLAGTLRATSQDVIDTMWQQLQAICDGVGRMTGTTITVTETAGVPPCFNAAAQADIAAKAAASVFGADKIHRGLKPYPFTDDFAYMLQQAPGAYVFVGQGGTMVHQTAYDFNDSLLAPVASLFTKIVEDRLS